MLNNDLIAKDQGDSAEITPMANFQYNPIRSASSSRSLMDTLSHDNEWYSSFNLWQGEMFLTVFRAETDGNLKTVNIPIAWWGSSNSDDLTISIHKTSYPFDTNGDPYDKSWVDGNGLLGGYDDNDDVILELVGTTWVDAGNNFGFCNCAYIIDNNQDPLGSFSASTGPANTPLKGLIWPVGSTTDTLNPTDHPSGDNWIQLSDYGAEPTVSAGDYIGVAVRYLSLIHIYEPTRPERTSYDDI